MTAARHQVLRAVDAVRAHPRHVVLFALVGGLLCGAWAPSFATLPAGAALVGAGRRPAAVLAVAAVLVGAAIGAERRDQLDRGRLPAALGSEVEQRMTVLEPVRRRASGERVVRAAVTGDFAAGEPLLLRLRPGTATRVRTGDVVAVRGRLRPLETFDRFQRRRGALAAVDVESGRVVGRRGGLAGALDTVRRRGEDGLARGTSPERAALLHGMVLGQDEAISQAGREAFQASGLAHLLAVSGTNVMLLATLALGAGALLGLPLRARLAATLGLVALYVPLTGAGPSIQRAGVMGAAGLVAALAGRPSSRWYAVGLAAAATLALNPYAAADPGWQLSFAAVAGLMVLAPRITASMERRGIPRVAAEAAAMTLAATVATAPLLAAHFERVSLVSLPANLVAAPAVAPLMWLGMVAVAAAQVAPALATPFTVPAGLLAAFVGGVAEVAARAPLASVDVRLGGPAAVVVSYLMIAAACFGAARLRRSLIDRGWRGRRMRRWSVAAAAVAIGAGAWAHAVSRADGPRPGETVVSFLDVGQGDATLVQHGGSSVLFDTGPPGGPVVSRLRDAGVRRLDALVITHAQADHEGAAIAVVEEFRPRLVVNGGAGWPTAVQRALPGAARDAGARVAPAYAGDTLTVAEARIHVLWPPRAPAQAPPVGDPNGRALVAHLRAGELDALLAADAESEALAGVDLPRAEVLKVAHHGSEDPGLPAALEEIRPQVAAIEVGRHNSYGHPAPSTLAALRAAVPVVVRTDRDGTVRVRSAGGAITVEGERGGRLPGR